jgi:hypothetical protein
MVPVIFEWYDEIEGSSEETTLATAMPTVPMLGDSVHFEGEDIVVRHVIRRSWVQSEGSWHMEVVLRK